MLNPSLPTETPAPLPLVDPGIRADLKQIIESMPASKMLGLIVAGFDARGVSRIEMPIRPALTFDGRVVQGGIVGVLADYAGVSAAACTLPEGWTASTTGFEVHNVAPAAGERLVAVGRSLHMGRSVAVSRAEVYALTAGAMTLVCVATTTCRPMPRNRRRWPRKSQPPPGAQWTDTVRHARPSLRQFDHHSLPATIMSHTLTRAAGFTADRAWGATDIAEMNGISVRLHWTDTPYVWHVNDGEEVFVVLDGRVDMHVRDQHGERVLPMQAGDIFHAGPGCEHVAHPQGEARILVVETRGSV